VSALDCLQVLGPQIAKQVFLSLNEYVVWVLPG